MDGRDATVERQSGRPALGAGRTPAAQDTLRALGRWIPALNATTAQEPDGPDDEVAALLSITVKLLTMTMLLVRALRIAELPLLSTSRRNCDR